MADGFDIWQGPAGYVAVTNPVRRRILDALAEGDKELPELVAITQRSKPTLSNLHVRELLAQGLVEELPHATDARRKVYRLRGKRIGSSSVPVEELRGAVRQYVTTSPMAFTLPFAAVVDTLLAARDAPEKVLRAQGRALGRASAHLFQAATARDLLPAVAGFLEREGVGRAQRIDFERGEVEFEIAERLASSKGDRSAVAVLLAGVLEGLAYERLGAKGAVAAKTSGDRRTVLCMPPG